MKKTVCILLSVAMLLLTLTGCSSNNDTTVESQLELTYDSAYSDYDESIIRAYQQVCSAVINYESEVRINTGMLDSVLQLYYTSFPLSVLTDGVTENEDGSGVTISYLYSKKEHLGKVNDFTEKIAEIKEKCFDGTSNQTIYTINLYHYIASSIKLSSDDAIKCYDTVMNGEGTSYSYANMLEYLLQQAGIPAYHILAQDNGGAGWGLSAAEPDGAMYYFDMMSEYYANGGEQLVYFGMTSEDAANEGLSSLLYTDHNVAADASDLRFDICRSCRSWEITDNALLVTSTNGDVAEVAL